VPLDDYRRRRDFTRSPEPPPESPAAAGAVSRFVVQEHHATSLHWDLRLERDGVLVSFALPRGVPLDPRQNRLAVRTEDHPLAYLTFAGEIPAGQYGAGRMTVFDEGTYETEKFRDDEIIVVLRGERVRGRYVLFRTDGANWMIHRMDPPEDPLRERMPAGIEPMLAKASPLPPDSDDWAYEIKWDGVRVVAFVQGGRVVLRSRQGIDVTVAYPEVRPLGAALGAVECVLDGEIVAFDERGRPSFERLQRRMNVTAAATATRLAASVPVTYEIFDLLFLEGRSTTALAWRDRRRLLEQLALSGAAWQTPPAPVGAGEAMMTFARDHEMEGVVAKRVTAPYEPGRRSGAWVKAKLVQRAVFVIGGYALGDGGRSGRIGALALGVREPDGRLRYAGRVGSGLGERDLDDLARRLVPRPTSPFDDGVVPAETVFVDPTERVEVEFAAWTSSGVLRHPTFKALRAGED
jgi:bifunctional non-homologous end joining protein LigD